jgi:uncharacterized protein
MSTSHLHVTWDDYNRLIERLAVRIRDSGWRPDQIVCLARGGLRVGDVLSRLFNAPLAVWSTSSYRAAAGTQQGDLKIAAHFTAPFSRLEGRVLIADDMVDSGVTLRELVNLINERERAITELRTAVLWVKACSVMQPDFYVDFLADNPWIHQPFEVYDTLPIDGLKGE